jgi:H+-transporting ATPase
VIIDAIKESRRIFQRMNSYAIYRIAETLRVLFFMTLAILIFNFYPLTAVMIVMLALLNDGAILSIAYDNVKYKDKPEAWNMRMVLGISTVLGLIGVVSAFGLFYLGERVFHLDRAHIQTLMYLKLSVAGHLTIFLTRTRGPFWSHRPARILWVAVVGTQIVATLIAVYGLFMTPLGWGWAGFVWGYALLWFLVNDRIKLLAYRIFDPVKAVINNDSKTEAKAEVQTDTKADPQADAKVVTKPDPKAGAKPEEKVVSEASSEAKPKTESKSNLNSTPNTKPKTATDLTPQIAARAYELYEREGHRDGQSAQNWDKAEQEIRATQTKTEPKTEIKPATKAGSQPEVKAELKPAANSKPDAEVKPTPAAKVEPAPEVKAPATPEVKAVPPSTAKAEPRPDTKNDIKPTDKVEAKPVAKAESKPEPNPKPAAEVSPQLVKRVHEFYEQLGREDVRAVQESDEAEQKIPEAETKK